jgi:xylulokinase
LGTSGVKAALVAEDGSTLAIATHTYALSSPNPGWAESDPWDWERAAKAAVAELREKVPHAVVEGIAVDGQMHGIVFTAADGSPVRPAMLWPDSRAVEQSSRWKAELSDAESAGLANPIVPGMAGPMIDWVARNEPDVLKTTSVVLFAKDWLRSRLIPGSFVTDASDASASLLWDVIADSWHSAAVSAAQLPTSALPAVRESGEIAGSLSAAKASEWLLPEGIPIAVGCSDVAATLLGLRAVPGQLTLVVGTGAQLLLPTIRPVADARPAFHTYRAADDSYFAMAAITNAGLAFQHVVSLLSADWAELYASAGRGPRASSPLFLPYVTGERFVAGAEANRGGWSGIGLGTTREDMLYAALEGVAFSIKVALASLPVVRGEYIDLVGGGSTHPGFVQLIADVTDRSLRLRTVENVTAVGAALLGQCAAGTTHTSESEPLPTIIVPAVRPRLDDRFARFVALTSALATDSPIGNQ